MSGRSKDERIQTLAQYEVVTGMNYGPLRRRLEPGDRLPADFPIESLGWLLEQRHIRKVEKE